MSVQKPNIVFVHVDQMHHKAISAYGCKYVHTPNLDKMVREGYSFMESYCACRNVAHREPVGLLAECLKNTA